MPRLSLKKEMKTDQALSQDLEAGCQKLAIVTLFGIQFFKGDHNILRLQP